MIVSLFSDCNKRGRGSRAGVSLTSVHPFLAHCVHCRHQTQKRSRIQKKKKQREWAREQQVGVDIMCTAAKLELHRVWKSASHHVTNTGSEHLFRIVSVCGCVSSKHVGCFILSLLNLLCQYVFFQFLSVEEYASECQLLSALPEQKEKINWLQTLAGGSVLWFLWIQSC